MAGEDEVHRRPPALGQAGDGPAHAGGEVDEDGGLGRAHVGVGGLGAGRQVDVATGAAQLS